MNCAPSFLALLVLCIFPVADCRAQGDKIGKAADPRLVKTFTATKPVKLDEAVADFVIDLVRKNTAGVQDSYRRLTAKTEEAAGGRYETRRFEGILWFVNEESWENRNDKFSRDGDYTYLARQQLVFGIHRGYSIPANVVGQVRVVTSLAGDGNGPDVKTGMVAPGTKIKLTFEGFLKSVPVESPE